jgi:hypothetical protein
MMGFEWDALRVEDHVLVHPPGSRGAVPVPGDVTMVMMRRGDNDIGIRIDAADGGHEVVWPLATAVHLLPLTDAAVCWRCAS